MKQDSPKSVYFYTLHKCASTLFSDYVLDNIDGLLKVDYSQQIIDGQFKPGEKPVFKDNGIIYGPIRVTTDLTQADGEIFIKLVTDHNFIRNKIAIFFIRDPRDILVSSYYFFGYSHQFSPVREVRSEQERQRDRIRQFTIDEFAIKFNCLLKKNFRKILELIDACERSSVLRYEDMIDNFEAFSSQLCKFASINKSVIQEIYKRTRPKDKEDIYSHRRSGKVEGFRNKLKSDTIELLNEELKEVLTRFNYTT